MLKTKTMISVIIFVFSAVLVEYQLKAPVNPPPKLSEQAIQAEKLAADPVAQSHAGQKPASSDQGTIIKFANPEALQAFLAVNNLATTELSPTSTPGVYTVKKGIDGIITLEGASAFPNRKYLATLTPDDPSYSQQWHLPKVSAPAAWDIATGSSTANKIAIIDTGFALSHQDLFDGWASNSGEVGGGKETNGIDDDSNGKIDDWRGWDFVCGNNSPQAGDADCDSEPNSQYADHGTLTSGTAGAITNNSTGTASLDWNVDVLPLQALADSGSGSTSDVADAIDYAVAQGAKVISMSLGSTSIDNYLRQRIDAAIAADVLVVAAAGNCGDPNTYIANGCDFVGQMLEPANYSPVIAVGATDSNDNRASFSSYGSTVDVVAPGVSIYATSWSNGNQTTRYGTASGTSLATPIVSGLAGLLNSTFPSASVTELENYLKNGAVKVGGMGGQSFTNQYGNGRIDAAGSLSNYSYTPGAQAAYTSSSKTVSTNLSQLSAGQTAWLTVQVTNTGTTTWQKNGTNPMRLGTEGPKDRNSRYYADGWLSPNRAASLNEDSVAPGGTGTFEFPIAVPPGGGTFTEKFNLVADGLKWLPDVGISFSTAVNSGYSWSFVGEQAYTDNTKSQAVDMSNVSPGQVVYFVVQAQNTGNATWFKNGSYPVRLATAKPFDRSSTFYDSSWISPNRPAGLVETSVAPGGMGSFETYFRIPNGSGFVAEYLNPVVDGVTHLNEVGLYLPAIINSSYAWAFVSQQAYTNSSKSTPLSLNSLQPNQSFYFVVQAQNTGNATWFKNGNFPIRLGTSHPLDRLNSLFYDLSWLSQNRPTGLTETSVAPGATGTFEATYRAPSIAGSYQEYLQPVADGITWLNDLGLHIPVTVVP